MQPSARFDPREFAGADVLAAIDHAYDASLESKWLRPAMFTLLCVPIGRSCASLERSCALPSDIVRHIHALIHVPMVRCSPDDVRRAPVSMCIVSTVGGVSVSIRKESDSDVPAECMRVDFTGESISMLMAPSRARVSYDGPIGQICVAGEFFADIVTKVASIAECVMRRDRATMCKFYFKSLGILLRDPRGECTQRDLHMLCGSFPFVCHTIGLTDSAIYICDNSGPLV